MKEKMKFSYGINGEGEYFCKFVFESIEARDNFIKDLLKKNGF